MDEFGKRDVKSVLIDMLLTAGSFGVAIAWVLLCTKMMGL